MSASPDGPVYSIGRMSRGSCISSMRFWGTPIVSGVSSGASSGSPSQ